MPAQNGKTRPASRDPQRTRSTILRVATAEFAARGFDGARVDRIAERCGLSKNMLYYYFGPKEELFVAVLEHVYQQLRNHQSKLSVQPDDPAGALRQLIHHTFIAFKEQPEVIRLLNEENLYEGRHIRRSKRIRSLYHPLLETLNDILHQGAAKGIFRKDLDAKLIYLGLASLLYHYLSNRYTLEFALETELSSQESQTVWLECVTEMILRYCYLSRCIADGA
jgi:TetR/AcrR family transcriptional regulator